MAVIYLSRGKLAIADEADYAWLVSGPKWSCDAKGYAVRHVRLPDGKRKMEKMHRVIIGAELGQKVDHRDHDTLNNRRLNLRVVTVRLNGQNRVRCKNKSTSVYKGVYVNRWGRFRASIKVDGKPVHVGMFSTEKEAAAAYNEAATFYFGEFASLNAVPSTSP